jgi:hypothetical protein
MYIVVLVEEDNLVVFYYSINTTSLHLNSDLRRWWCFVGVVLRTGVLYWSLENNSSVFACIGVYYENNTSIFVSQSCRQN